MIITVSPKSHNPVKSVHFEQLLSIVLEHYAQCFYFLIMLIICWHNRLKPIPITHLHHGRMCSLHCDFSYVKIKFLFVINIYHMRSCDGTHESDANAPIIVTVILTYHKSGNGNLSV